MIETAVICDRCKVVMPVGQVLDFKSVRERVREFGWTSQSMRTDFCPDCSADMVRAAQRQQQFKKGREDV